MMEHLVKFFWKILQLSTENAQQQVQGHYFTEYTVLDNLDLNEMNWLRERTLSM